MWFVVAAVAQEVDALQEDLPPTVVADGLWVEVGEVLRDDLAARASDPEGRPLQVRVEGLPPGATFDPTTGVLTFTPTAADVGEHVLVLTAADEHHEERAEVTLEVDPRSWSRGFVPGVSFVAMTTRAEPERWWAGPVADFDLLAFGDPEDNGGPSHGRWYAFVGLLPAGDQDVILTYGTGLALSVEGAAARRVLIPEFGLEVVGTAFPGEPHVPSLAPFGGVWLWNDEHLAIDARCGYGYALRDVATWSGVRCGSSAHVALW